VRNAGTGRTKRIAQGKEYTMALEWLKEILGDAHTDEIDKKVRDEIGKAFVSKKDFDARKDKIDALEVQIAERDKQLKELGESTGDSEALKTKISELQTANEKAAGDLTALEAKHAKELADRDFDSLLDGVLAGEKVRNAKAVKALLDIDVLKASKNQTEDIKTALTAVKTDNDYLFSSEEPIKNPITSGKNDTPKGTAESSVLRSIMGLPAETKGD
jgi:hypothetical protein